MLSSFVISLYGDWKDIEILIAIEQKASEFSDRRYTSRAFTENLAGTRSPPTLRSLDSPKILELSTRPDDEDRPDARCVKGRKSRVVNGNVVLNACGNSRPASVGFGLSTGRRDVDSPHGPQPGGDNLGTVNESEGEGEPCAATQLCENLSRGRRASPCIAAMVCVRER